MAVTKNFMLTTVSEALNKALGTDSHWFDSSVIRYAGYYSGGKTLYIRFTSGKEYAYMNVDESVWHDFVDAESQGKFFNKYIRNKYEFERLGEAA